MNLRSQRFLIPVLISLAAVTLGQAQTTVTTDPVGFTTLTATSTHSAGTPTYSLVSLDLTRPVDYSGIVPAGGVSSSGSFGSVLTFSAGTFTGLTLSGTGNSHYIEITNGSGAGVMSAIVSSDNDHTITLADDLSAVIDNAGGTTTLKTRPHWTFATAFGANNSAGFQGSTSTTNADLIQILNPTTGALATYYYNTNNNHWQTGLSDASNVIIPPDRGMMITRKQATSVNFVLQGSVKLGTTGIYITGGTGSQTIAGVISNPFPLSSGSLSASGLYTGNAATGLVGSNSSTNADLLQVLNPTTGALTTYYYNTTNSHWQTGLTDASAFTIPDGSAVLITRKNGRGSFTWYMPQPSINLN